MRILHLEDDPDIRDITKMALELSAEFEVLQCSSGDEALEKASGFMPDLLLFDVMLPGLSGPMVLKLLRERPELKNVPAIFMTARVQLDEVKSLMELGSIGLISKPFDAMTLGGRILEIINSRTG